MKIIYWINSTVTTMLLKLLILLGKSVTLASVIVNYVIQLLTSTIVEFQVEDCNY